MRYFIQNDIINKRMQIVSLVMMPTWLLTIGNRLLSQGGVEGSATSLGVTSYSSSDVHTLDAQASEVVQIPFVHIVASILLNTVPLIIGVTLSKFKPQLAEKLRYVDLRDSNIHVLHVINKDGDNIMYEIGKPGYLYLY